MRVGEAFYDANYGHFNWDGIGTIVLSANQDGTGSTLVDDKIQIRVWHEDGSSSVFRHDYSHGCGFSSSMPPTAITSLFHIGSNKIAVVLQEDDSPDRVRTSDIVARYSGEEFVLLLPETGKVRSQAPALGSQVVDAAGVVGAE